MKPIVLIFQSIHSLLENSFSTPSHNISFLIQQFFYISMEKRQVTGQLSYEMW